MEVVKFLKEYVRMCNSFEDCSDCLLAGQNCLLYYCGENIEVEKIVEIVEKWSAENPQKTILQDFLEKYPNAPKEEDGMPMNVCPFHLGYAPNGSCVKTNCIDCWKRPLEG